jgi:hypothetical protein
MSLILTKSEIARIKASVLPSVDKNDAAARKAELKKKSEDRLKNWPNTLEALRLKKESFLKDREAQDELDRQKIDIEVLFYMIVVQRNHIIFSFTGS